MYSQYYSGAADINLKTTLAYFEAPTPLIQIVAATFVPNRCSDYREEH